MPQKQMINIKQHLTTNNTFALRVIPNASRQELREENNSLKLYLTSVPEKNKANREVISFFKQHYKLKVEIVAGAVSRRKVLRVLDPA